MTTRKLTSVVAQSWRSIRSRRSFSSYPGNNIGEDVLIDALKATIPSFKTFNPGAWVLTGFALYGCTVVYKGCELMKRAKEVERKRKAREISK